MILNFIFFSLFLFILTIFGNFFNYCATKKLNIQIYNNHIIYNLIASLFFLGVIVFFLNFFVPINSFISFIIFLLIFLFALKNFNRGILNDLKRNIIIIFFVSIITLNMQPGYDAGLYHIPFQTWIRDYQIIFGMFNIHERFAHHSIYSYIAAPLWFNNFNLLNYLQGSFIIVFIFFLKNLLNTKKIFNVGIVLTTLLSLPIWIRYFDLGYSLVDLIFGLFFFITFIIGLTFLLPNQNSKELVQFNFFYFYLLATFLFFLKPSGMLIFPYFMYICFMSLKKKLIDLKVFYNYSIIFFIVVSFWILKNLIMFGCLIYGSKFFCFDFKWSNITLVEQSLNDISFYKRHFALINYKNFYLYLKNELIYILPGIFYITTLYVVIKKNFFEKKYFLYFIIICSFFVNFLIYDFSSLKGFTSLSTDYPEISKNIIFKEIIILGIILLNSSIITLLIFYNFNNKFAFEFNINKLVILGYILFILLIWFFNAPDPRFAFGFFAIIPPIIFFILINKQSYNIEISKVKFSFINTLFYIVLFVYFIIQPLTMMDNMSFRFNKVKTIDYIEREGFGVKPNSLITNQTNFCWNLKDCYFHEKDIKFIDFFYNYKIAIN